MIFWIFRPPTNMAKKRKCSYTHTHAHTLKHTHTHAHTLTHTHSHTRTHTHTHGLTHTFTFLLIGARESIIYQNPCVYMRHTGGLKVHRAKIINRRLLVVRTQTHTHTLTHITFIRAGKQ